MKTDEDYIRAGIDLADGWDLKRQRDGKERIDNPVCVGFPIVIDDLNAVWKDALAAQLVLQVDALENQPINIVSYPDVTQVFHLRTAKDEMISYCGGEGRTMNTIKAIVDSGVLISEGGTMRTGRGKPGHSPAQGVRTTDG